jgi:hypothetical protein
MRVAVGWVATRNLAQSRSVGFWGRQCPAGSSLMAGGGATAGLKLQMTIGSERRLSISPADRLSPLKLQR